MRQKIFEPLVSTKSNGLGLQIVLITMIIDRHTKRLRLLEYRLAWQTHEVDLPEFEARPKGFSAKPVEPGSRAA